MTEFPIENPRSRFQFVIIWLLLVALLAAPIAVLQQYDQRGVWQPALWLMAAVVAFGIFSTRYLTRLPSWERNRGQYRSAEFFVICTVIRIILWLTVDPFPDWRDFLREPWTFFPALFWGYIVLAGWGWSWAIWFTQHFAAIEISDLEERFYSLPYAERNKLYDTPLVQDRSKLVGEFFGRWVFGGAILVFFTAVSSFQLGDFMTERWITTVRRLPFPPIVLFGLLTYFFAGLWLLGYGRYTALYARWLGDGTAPQPALARQWRRMTFILIGGFGTVAAFLPIGSSAPIARIIGYIGYALLAIGAFLFNGLLLALASLSGEGGEETAQQPFEPIPTPQLETFVEPAREPRSNPFAEVPAEVWGGTTIVIVLAILVIAVLVLLRGRYGSIRIATNDFWQRLVEWWQQLRRELATRAADLQRSIQERAGRVPSTLRKPGKPQINLSALTPREQIRYFYLSAVERAEAAGVFRKPSQTPAEYLKELQAEWPESAEAEADLTEAFLAARYSPDEIEKEEVGTIRKTWKQVRSTLKRK